jgi:hypothetical protein
MHNPIEAHGDLAPQLWETYVAASRAPQPMDSLTLSEFKPERRRSSDLAHGKIRCPADPEKPIYG